MMTKKYIFRQKHPDTGKKTNRVGMITIFDEAEMHRVPEGAVEVGDEPVEDDKDGAYFEAWRIMPDSTVEIDMDAAKDIRMEWLRERRDSLLKHLDGVQFRCYCSKEQEEIDSIEKSKNELRDFPDKINWDVILTVHDIKHILPPCLV